MHPPTCSAIYQSENIESLHSAIEEEVIEVDAIKV